MCKYCEESAFNEIINSTKLNGSLIGWDKNMLATELDEDDNSVVIEIRNGAGYIRLGDKSDMNCLDHEEKFQINYCPMCGEKLS